MLVLSRQRDETIMIGDDIEITIVDIRGDKVRLGITAPATIPVHRKEVYDAIQRENREAAKVKMDDLTNLPTPPHMPRPQKGSGAPGPSTPGPAFLVKATRPTTPPGPLHPAAQLRRKPARQRTANTSTNPTGPAGNRTTQRTRPKRSRRLQVNEVNPVRADLADAADEQQQLERIATTTDFAELQAWLVPAKDVLMVASKVVAGQLARAKGDRAAAETALREAATLQANLSYMEPPYWYYPVRQTLAAVLLEDGRPDDAVRRVPGEPDGGAQQCLCPVRADERAKSLGRPGRSQGDAGTVREGLGGWANPTDAGATLRHGFQNALMRLAMMKMQAAVRRARMMWPSLSWRRSSRLLANNQAQSCSTTLRTLPSPEPCASPI